MRYAFFKRPGLSGPFLITEASIFLRSKKMIGIKMEPIDSAYYFECPDCKLPMDIRFPCDSCGAEFHICEVCLVTFGEHKMHHDVLFSTRNLCDDCIIEREKEYDEIRRSDIADYNRFRNG